MINSVVRLPSGEHVVIVPVSTLAIEHSLALRGFDTHKNAEKALDYVMKLSAHHLADIVRFKAYIEYLELEVERLHKEKAKLEFELVLRSV